MDAEIERFFNSINFESEEFFASEIDKVKLITASQSFEVVIKNPYVIDKKEMDNLFKACEGGINGEKKCHVVMEYGEVTLDDLTKYIDAMIDELVNLRPSFAPLKDRNLEFDGD
jgi:3-methyladenine DNA glycosylase/8-oxoguanine DNA glycosylase